MTFTDLIAALPKSSNKGNRPHLKLVQRSLVVSVYMLLLVTTEIRPSEQKSGLLEARWRLLHGYPENIC